MQAEHVLGDGSVRQRAPRKYRQGDDNEDFHKRGSQLADEPFPFVARPCPISLQNRQAWNRNGVFLKENRLQTPLIIPFPRTVSIDLLGAVSRNPLAAPSTVILGASRP